MCPGYMVESVARDLLRESILVPGGVAWCDSRLTYMVSIMSDDRTFCPTVSLFYGLGWILSIKSPIECVLHEMVPPVDF